MICDLLMFSDTSGLIPVNFRIQADDLDDSASNVLRFGVEVLEVLEGFEA